MRCKVGIGNNWGRNCGGKEELPPSMPSFLKWHSGCRRDTRIIRGKPLLQIHLQLEKNNRSNTNTNTNTNTKTSQVLQDKKNNQSPNIWRKKEKMRAKYHPHSNIFGGNLTLSNFELGGRQLRTWDWARKNTFYMSSYPLYIWNGHVMCTISWGHKMCQLLNSFKLMGTDEHMGGPRATGNKFWLLWKRGSQLTLRFRSITMLLLLKPAPGYKLESLGSFDRLWFPVRKMVKGIK